ncbi:MAG: hypothetical protein JKX98_11850 [Alcanivoracaceae bacterium]|nr:hypothetical protein [Alcanivoracaceae bacterium]
MNNPKSTQQSLDVMTKIIGLFSDLMNHDGYGDMRIEMRILKRGQKEIIVHCGKQYRFVVNNSESQENLKNMLKKLSC